jgi:hypothetical protein
LFAILRDGVSTAASGNDDGVDGQVVVGSHEILSEWLLLLNLAYSTDIIVHCQWSTTENIPYNNVSFL